MTVRIFRRKHILNECILYSSSWLLSYFISADTHSIITLPLPIRFPENRNNTFYFVYIKRLLYFECDEANIKTRFSHTNN